MMDITETIEGMKNALGDRLSTRTAYGDPIEVDGVTVIPVARVFLGFGAGGGVGPSVGEVGLSTNGDDADASAPVGGGGGGGGLVQPLGFIEIDTTGASVEWDFGDGTSGTGGITNHTFASAGQYTVTATVTLADGSVVTIDRTLLVETR